MRKSRKSKKSTYREMERISGNFNHRVARMNFIYSHDVVIVCYV